jgi:hypothetical protein
VLNRSAGAIDGEDVGLVGDAVDHRSSDSLVTKTEQAPSSVELTSAALSDRPTALSPSQEPPHERSPRTAGSWNVWVRPIPAARPFAATTKAILREASSIISSPSITAPRAPPTAEV